MIVDKLDLSAERDDKAAYMIAEHARDALKKLAYANYNNDGDKKIDGMTRKELCALLK